MGTDAKNLVTAARSIHVTIHMISMLRKEPCSGSIQDLGHIPTPSCLTDCLTKASAKADNLIKALKTVRLVDVDIHLNFRTLMEHKASFILVCRNVECHENIIFSDSRIQFPWSVISILMRMLCLCLTLMNALLGVALRSSSFVTMAVLRPRCVESDGWSPDDDQPCEDYYYEAIAFSRHSINLELDEESMKPEKATMAPTNAGSNVP